MPFACLSLKCCCCCCYLALSNNNNNKYYFSSLVNMTLPLFLLRLHSVALYLISHSPLFHFEHSLYFLLFISKKKIIPYKQRNNNTPTSVLCICYILKRLLNEKCAVGHIYFCRSEPFNRCFSTELTFFFSRKLIMNSPRIILLFIFFVCFVSFFFYCIWFDGKCLVVVVVFVVWDCVYIRFVRYALDCGYCGIVKRAERQSKGEGCERERQRISMRGREKQRDMRMTTSNNDAERVTERKCLERV